VSSFGGRATCSTRRRVRCHRSEPIHVTSLARIYGEVLLDVPFREIGYVERYNALCAAALCGTSRGLDAGSLDAPELSDWRRQASAVHPDSGEGRQSLQLAWDGNTQ
jgi:hypothetical protein